MTYCRGLQMDLYPPAAASGPPALLVLYIHGGAWRSGSRQDTGDHFPELRARIQADGVFVAALDYRLAGEAGWPAPLDDVRCGISYLERHIHPRRIELYGTSAGGQIASMTALARVPGVDRVVDMYGPADLAAPGWNRWMKADIRAEFGTGLVMASPADQVAGPAPAFFVIQGDCDTIVPVAQSREFVARLRAAGVPVRYLEVHDAGHALGPCGGRPQQPAVVDVIAAVVGFLTS